MALVLKKGEFVLNLALEFCTARQTVLVRSPDVPDNLANGGRTILGNGSNGRNHPQDQVTQPRVVPVFHHLP